MHWFDVSFKVCRKRMPIGLHGSKGAFDSQLYQRKREKFGVGKPKRGRIVWFERISFLHWRGSHALGDALGDDLLLPCQSLHLNELCTPSGSRFWSWRMTLISLLLMRIGDFGKESKKGMDAALHGRKHPWELKDWVGNLVDWGRVQRENLKKNHGSESID